MQERKRLRDAIQSTVLPGPYTGDVRDKAMVPPPLAPPTPARRQVTVTPAQDPDRVLAQRREGRLSPSPPPSGALASP